MNAVSDLNVISNLCLKNIVITIMSEYMDLLCSRGINVFNIEFIGLDPTFNELKIIYQISNEVYVAK